MQGSNSELVIGQLAAYDINIGDNIAIQNIRNHIEDAIDIPIRWERINIIDFIKMRNDINYCKDQLNEISNRCDYLIIGGGGLLEGSDYNKFPTNYKLPLSESTIKSLSIPYTIFGVGVNVFRGQDSLTKEGVESFKVAVEHADLASVRNDGSYELLIDDLGESIQEIPDPGIMMPFQKHRKSKLDKGYFQPSFNNKSKINASRGLDDHGLLQLQQFIKEYNLKIIPHTKKDFLLEGEYAIEESALLSQIALDDFMSLTYRYLDCDYSIAMRGHGQLMAIGMNLPSVYLSTQDKVRDFSIKNGFEEFNVDISDDGWLDKLKSKVELLKAQPWIWYEIRDKKMQSFESCYKTFNDKVVAKIYSAYHES